MTNTEKARAAGSMLDSTPGWVLLWTAIFACPVVFWVALWFLVPGRVFLTLLGLPVVFALLVVGLGALRSRFSHKKAVPAYSKPAIRHEVDVRGFTAARRL